MNEQSSIPNRTAPVWYATHGNHLHAYLEESEAAQFAASVGGSYYSSFDIINAMRERKGLVEITLAAIQLLTAPNSLFKALAYGELRAALLAHGNQLVKDVEAGKLDGITPPEKLAAMKSEIEEQKLIGKAEQNIDRRVRVVRQPASAASTGKSLVGREFEIAAYNPVTDSVLVEVAGVEGDIELTPDDYVFADEYPAVDATVAPTTDKLRD